MTNKKQSRRAYSLKHETKDGQILTFNKKEVNDGTSAKFNLTDIDAFTTEFDNFEHFKQVMSCVFPSWNGTKYWIECSQNSRLIKLPLVFKNQEILKKVSKENKGEENIKKDPWLNNYLNEFLLMVYSEKEKIAFLRNNKYIVPRLNTLLENLEKAEINNDSDNIRIVLSQIRNLLSKYYIIRKIEIGKDHYDRMYKKKKDINSFNQDEKIKEKTLSKVKKTKN